MSSPNIKFPSHNVPQKKKDYSWCLQYCKGAWTEYNSFAFESFYKNRSKYVYYLDYALSKQSINKYKKLLKLGESTDESYLNMDWTPLGVFTKYRELAIAIVGKMDYNVNATPIDILAYDEIQGYFKSQEVKIKLREQLGKINPELAQSGPAAMLPGEPEDMDELEIQKNFTYKHNMAVELEEGIEAVLNHNNFDEQRAKVRRSIFDFGVGGYKEFIDTNGAIKIRAIDPSSLVMSRVTKRDFSDWEYVGEVIEMTIADIKAQAGDSFTEDQYRKMAEQARGKFGNPNKFPIGTIHSMSYDDFKVRVLDLEWFSVDHFAYEKNIDKRGNKHISRTNPKKEGDNIERHSVKTVYKAKWLIDSEYMWDWGLATDMKRAQSRLMDTSLSYHVFAPIFDDVKMQAVGWVERCISIIDQMNLSWFKLQQAIANARPRGFAFDLNTLDDVPLGRGGRTLTPYEVLKLYVEKGIYPYRRHSADLYNANSRPFEDIPGGMAGEAQEWFADIYNKMQLLRDTLGLNELTDASTPDPRTLTTTAKLAAASTNNALYGIIEADRHLLKSLYESVTLRLQTVARTRPNSQYQYAVGKNSLKFFKASPKLSTHEFAIRLEDRPDDEQRAMFMQELQALQMEGQLDIEDIILLKNTDNLKKAQQVMAYKIKKRRKAMQQEAMQQQQMNGQIQQQSVMVAEQAKQQTLQMEHQFEMERLMAEKEWDYKIAALTVSGRLEEQTMKGDTDVITTAMKGDSDEYKAEILAAASKERTVSQKANDASK